MTTTGKRVGASLPRPRSRPTGLFRRGLPHWAAAATVGLASSLATSASSAADPASDSQAPTPPPGEVRLASADERVVQLNEEGSELYAAGDYRRAAERFLQAYAVDQDPNLLFNVASCYEGLGDLDAAIEKYRAFLADPAADAEGRPRAERAIERLHAELAERRAPKPAPAPTPVVPTPPVAVPEEPIREPAWLPWVGLGGGAALTVLGASVYALGAADHADVTGAPGYDDAGRVTTMTRAEADDLVRSGNAKKAVGVASVSAGGALAAAYLIWWLSDPLGQPEAEPKVDVTVSRSAARVTLESNF